MDLILGELEILTGLLIFLFLCIGLLFTGLVCVLVAPRAIVFDLLFCDFVLWDCMLVFYVFPLSRRGNAMQVGRGGKEVKGWGSS